MEEATRELPDPQIPDTENPPAESTSNLRHSEKRTIEDHGIGVLLSGSGQGTLRTVSAKLAEDLDSLDAMSLKSAQFELNTYLNTASRMVGNTPDIDYASASVVKLLISKDGTRKMIFANVGDTSIWLYQNGNLTRLTNPDTNVGKHQQAIDNAEKPQDLNHIKGEPAAFERRDRLNLVLGSDSVHNKVQTTDVPEGAIILLTSPEIEKNLTVGQMAAVINDKSSVEMAGLLEAEAQKASQDPDNFRAQAGDPAVIALNPASYIPSASR